MSMTIQVTKHGAYYEGLIVCKKLGVTLWYEGTGVLRETQAEALRDAKLKLKETKSLGV